MSTTQHHDADRETLSALFDGELQGDAARFALKRLDHDAHWRETCGRWQLAGDALRGQAMAAAPAGFADRVGAALASEKAASVSTAAAAGYARTAAHRATPSRRRWIGGAAMAASVAAAALFVTRPLPESSVPSAPTAQVATSGQPAASTSRSTDPVGQQTPAPASVAQTTTPQATRLPVAEIGFAAAAVTTDAPRLASEPPPRERTQPTVSSPSQSIDNTLTVAAAPTAIASTADAVPAGIEPSSTHPFLPQGEIVSRPWPRAVLPNYPAGGAFTASFDSSAAPGSSSFYPFEPRMLGADRPQQPAPDPSEWPQR